MERYTNLPALLSLAELWLVHRLRVRTAVVDVLALAHGIGNTVRKSKNVNYGCPYPSGA